VAGPREVGFLLLHQLDTAVLGTAGIFAVSADDESVNIWLAGGRTGGGCGPPVLSFLS